MPTPDPNRTDRDVRGSRRRRGPRHARRLRSHAVARAIGLTLTAALAMVGTGAAATYVDLKNAVHHSDALSLVAGKTPTTSNPKDPFAGRALNVIIIGTDYRDAANAALAGEDPGMRADTTMMMHISADRKWIEFFSIPRDLLVTIPSCKLPGGGETSTQYNAMFNSAFQTGGGSSENMDYAAACTIAAANELTGIMPTDMIVVKMTGVVSVVNALGGVTMCLPEAVHESKAYGNLDLPAGKSTLDGRTSLEFLRARHGHGMGLDQGSDLTRITRQQAFLNALQHQITSSGLFSNPTKMYGVAKASLNSLLVSKDFTLTSLPGLAWSLRNLNSSNVVFSQLNVVDAPSNPNRLVLAGGTLGAENDAMFQRFKDDTPPASVDASAPPSAASSSAGPSHASASNSGTTGGASQSGTTGGASQSGTTGGASQSGTTGGASQSGTTGGASQSGTTGGTSSATSALPAGVCPS